MYQSKSVSGMVERSGSKCAGREKKKKKKKKEQRRGELAESDRRRGKWQVRMRSVALGVPGPGDQDSALITKGDSSCSG
jgi:hypothetical protein